MVSIVVVMRPLSNLDEVWNFNIARCISSGLVPYKDISMVSTPLLGFIVAIPLKLFGHELFYARICSIIFGLISFILIFKILKNLGIKREISNLVILLVLAIIINYIALDYNFLALILVLSIILSEIKAIRLQSWKLFGADVLIGILAGLVICCKQSIGLIISIIAVLNPLFYISKKKHVKECTKIIGKRILGVCIPVLVFVTYLCANNAFYNFIDYSVKGIKTFSNMLPYSSLVMSGNLFVRILSIIVPLVMVICFIVCIVGKIRKRDKNMLYILTLYSLGMFTVSFPISDYAHFVFAIVPSIILFVYGLKLLLLLFKKVSENDFKYTLAFINIFSILLILTGTLWIELMNNDNLSKISKYDYQKHFRYIYVSDEVSKSIKLIDEFSKTKEQNVYILDAMSPIYMIPMDRYNKNYDMFRIGNFGSGGEDSIIECIKNEDALYLIVKDDKKLNWQNPSKVRAYMLENMELVESVGIFDVYRNTAYEDGV